MPPKAILFDIGRVIVRLDLKRAFAPFVPVLPASNGGASKSPEQIWTALQSDPRWWDWQEGRMTPPEWHEYMTRHLGIAPSFEEFRAAWNSVLDPETILPESLFAQLASRHGVRHLRTRAAMIGEHLRAPLRDELGLILHILPATGDQK